MTHHAPARVLCVDDEPLVLDGLRRNLAEAYEVVTAVSAEAALALVDRGPPFAVIVSDMRMPGVTGAELLAAARLRAPDTTRMLLTGQSDLASAVAAVNEGGVFRFLVKPCPPDELAAAVADGVRLHRLATTQREVLEQTLVKSLRVMNDLMELMSPGAASRGSFLRSYVGHVTRVLGLDDPWIFEAAATLSQLGTLTLPSELRERQAAALPLTPAQAHDVMGAFEVTARMVADIPRMAEVAQIIRHLGSPLGLGASAAAAAGEPPAVVLGVELVQAALAFDRALRRGESVVDAASDAGRQRGVRRDIARALESYAAPAAGAVARAVRVAELMPRMVFEEDVRTRAGALLVSAGKEVDFVIMAHLRHCLEGVGVREPIKVRVPVAETRSGARPRAGG